MENMFDDMFKFFIIVCVLLFVVGVAIGFLIAFLT